MDMGIAGRTALVCAASKGLGRGCAEALAAEGVNLVIVARTAETLEATAAEIRAQSGVEVKTVACDITTPEGRAAALAACPQPDILVNNAGGPPPGDFRKFTHDDWIRALEANMLTPIELIRATIDHMSARGFGRIVNITSSAVKAPIDVLGLSNGARSGLTGFVAGVARSKVARDGVTINNLLPGLFDTDRIATTFDGPGQGATHLRRRSAQAAHGDDPGRPLRQSRRIRPRLCVPVQRACGLHHRAELAARRRRLSGYVLSAARSEAPASPSPQQRQSQRSQESYVMTTRIALIAHDHKKDDIVKLAGEYVDTLRRCDIVATGTTGTRIADAHGLTSSECCRARMAATCRSARSSRKGASIW